MTDLNRELSELLSRERSAALSADLETLESLQVEKRALIEAAQQHEIAIGPRLVQMARANIALMRRLTALQLALAGVDDNNGYGSDGHSTAGAFFRRARGAL